MKHTAADPTLVLPEHQTDNRTALMRTLGYIFRAVLAFLCSWGLCTFIFDSLSAQNLRWITLISCALACAVFSLMLAGRRSAIAGGCVCAAGVIYLALHRGSLIHTLRAVGLRLYNAWNERLDVLGYDVTSNNIIDISDSLEAAEYTEAGIMSLAAVLAAVLISALIVTLTIRRVRLLPILFFGAAVSALIHYFGACDDNLGFALMLASLCGLISLSFYDRIYASKSSVGSALGTDPRSAAARDELRHTLRVGSELGGFVGLASTLISLAILAYPMSIGTPMPDIPAISEPAHRIEDYISAAVSGKLPSPSGIFFLGSSGGAARVTEATERTQNGDRIFDVQTDVSIPIYLRTWTGLDYTGDSWHTADYSRIYDYKSTFGDGFSAELLTYELLYALDPSLTALPETKRYSLRSDFGYVIAPVHIKKLTYLGNDVFLPSYTDQRTGLLKYGTRESHDAGYSNYYDGIFESGSFFFTTSYTTVAALGLEPTEDTAKNIAILVNYYADQYALIAPLREMLAKGASETEIQREYNRLYAASIAKHYLSSDFPTTASGTPVTTVSGAYTFPSESLAYRYAYEMSAEERSRIHALTDNLPLYYEYVYDNYLSACEGFGRFEVLISRIAADNNINLRRDAATYAGRHRITDAVIDYLSKNMVYTLDPKAPSSEREYYNAAETFLFDTHEGYCVQYATSAVMLLRAAGIPARYADGYIVKNFAETRDAGAVGRYRALVLDEHAHAWIEVYYDYYGWVRYEATAPYVSEREDIPLPSDTEPSAPETAAPVTESAPHETASKPDITVSDGDTEPSVGVSSSPEPASREIPAGIIVAVPVLALAAVVVLIIKHRADAAQGRRRRLIQSAADGISDSDRRLAAAREMGDMLMKLLAFERFVPQTGEPPSRFALRVDEMMLDLTLTPFAPVLAVIQASEFGGDVTSDQLRTLAEYLDILSRVTAHLGSLPRRLFRRYFLMR